MIWREIIRGLRSEAEEGQSSGPGMEETRAVTLGVKTKGRGTTE